MRSQVTPRSLTTKVAQPLVSLSCLFVLFLYFSVPVTAHAQLGKLKKMGTDVMKDKAKEAAGVKNPEGTPANGGARIDYAITEERLTGIMDYLAPLVDEAERQASYRHSVSAYKAQLDAASDCVNKGSASVTPDIEASMSPKVQALMAKTTGYTEKLNAANATKNYRAIIAYSDSAAVSQVQFATLMFPSLKCPAVPYKSAAMIDAEAATMAQQRSGQSSAATATSHTVPAANRAGLTTGQFGRIRERMAIWLLVQSGDLPATADKFTDAEQALLTGKGDALKRYGPLFKDGIMPWATWGDITAW